MTRRLWLLGIVGAVVMAAGAPNAQAARGLKIGLTDGVFESSDAGTRDLWLDRAVRARSNLVLITAGWGGIAPGSRPAGFNPRNPVDPAYSWGELDNAVRDASARGLRVVLLVTSAPRWAEGKHRRPSAAPGSWKPKPGALDDFGHAIAARYSGSLPTLPRVRFFQLWAEPNMPLYLNPQWHHHHPASPKHYRAMLNGFYRGIKSSVHGDKVVTGGTAPYGDSGPGGFGRVRPAAFWRGVLCLKGRRLRKARCKHPAHFNVFAHNPINVGPPTQHAFNRDDVSTPDIGRLKRILHKAQRTHRVRPKGHKPIWATEIWWDSKPPDPHGYRARKQARFVEQAFYVLWRQGVKSVVWFLIRDQAPNPSYAATYQSGLFFRSGGAKPAYRAFGFPFVADRKGSRKVRLWGKAPASGRLRIQRRRGGHWRTIKHLHAGGNHVFVGSDHVRGRARLRAVQGSEKSLVWPLG